MVCWLICARCLVKFRKWLLPRESFPTSPQMGRIDRDPSRGARHGGRSVSQAPEKESPKGIAGMADCDDCLLWPEPASSEDAIGLQDNGCIKFCGRTTTA